MPATDKLKHLVIHTSDSAWGDVTEITKWHIAKGWTTIGYHYVITNPYPTYNDLKKKTPQLAFNGKVCLGRDTDHDGDVDEEIGAHTLGYNTKSIGICLIGKKRRIYRRADSICYRTMHSFMYQIQHSGSKRHRSLRISKR